ncbi:hypothetical protein [Photorhabdus heterorhabditis]|uniref:hypothetical protein n=1 Tax=Photorhabdus heterorhabditis TaxID=880156 RepID=UPI001562BBDB|nr:hypothetical protein [Photorhabdus heterorhabditis]NRN27323.1 hypothetical protein [Photorhabdus heterorhabditis subsp. aluminescens]
MLGWLSGKYAEVDLYLLSFKLPLGWLHSLTPVTELSMFLGMRSLAAALQIEIYWV